MPNEKNCIHVLRLGIFVWRYMDKPNQKTTFSVELDALEASKLEKIALETSRSKGAVVRRLLSLADLPEAKILLGQSLPSEKQST